MRAPCRAAALPAAAQEQPTELGDVYVTGIRVGIENAIEAKRESTSIVEAVSAEDIGKLPDTSIAESISRLPGLTSQRAEGRASAISLRGTDPGFTTALMNGREQVSTGDNRSVEFDQYPSELISSVLVYKTPDSQLAAQGLAGTIDLRTIRPIQYGKYAVALNFRAEQNSNDDMGAGSDDQGYRASFSLVDQFMDGKFGIAFGYAHLDTPMATRGFGTYEPWNPSGGGGASDCPGGTAGGCFNNPGVAAGQFATNGMKVRADIGSTVRDGFMATLQFEPGGSYSSILDLYYSTMDQTDYARSLEVNLGGYPAPCCVGGPFPDGTVFGYSDTTIENDTVVAGTVNNVTPLARNFAFTTEDEIMAGGWRNKFQLNDDWTLVADISYSKATRDQFQPEINAQYGPNLVFDTGTFELRGNHAMPSLHFGLDYTDPALVVVGPTIYGSGYTKKPHIEDELTSFRVDAIREGDMGWFSSTSFGVNYSDRSKDKTSPESGLSTIGGGAYQIADEFVLSPTNLTYAQAGHALAIDVNGVLREYFNPVVYGDPTTLHLPRRQVLERGRGSDHRLPARRPGPRTFERRDPEGQRRPAGHPDGPELGRLLHREWRRVPRRRRQDVHGRPAAAQFRLPARQRPGGALRPRRGTRAAAHGPAEGDRGERLRRRDRHPGRQRRQSAARSLAGLGLRRVV